MNPVEVVLQFLERINQHNADKLAELMTEDHVFIDSLGQSVRGREKMRTGWQSYFAFCPDYWVTHEEIFQHGILVAVFGAAGHDCGEWKASRGKQVARGVGLAGDGGRAAGARVEGLRR